MKCKKEREHRATNAHTNRGREKKKKRKKTTTPVEFIISERCAGALRTFTIGRASDFGAMTTPEKKQKETRKQDVHITAKWRK